MLLIQDKLVSDALIEESFVCHLEKCQGACCWKGDYGAPLEEAEIETLRDILPALKPYLDPESVEQITVSDFHAHYKKNPGFEGTALRENGACVFMRRRPDGVAECGIEAAWEDGVTDFRKPISCHLYPVRVKKIDELGFEALNYDDWEICSPACTLGQSLKVPLYEFVSEAIVRKYGQEFYDDLKAVAKDLGNG